MTNIAILPHAATVPGYPPIGSGHHGRRDGSMIHRLASVVATPLVTALIGVAEGLAELLLLYFVGTSVTALVGLG